MCSYPRILVTGGAGFIGSHLVDRLLLQGVDVVVLDNLYSGRLENIKQHVGRESFRFIQGDVRDHGLVKELVKDIDAVFHLAALVSVPESFRDPVLTNDINVGGTLNLLRACVGSDVQRFVYASSCGVYGNAENLPIREDCPTMPNSPYGASKRAAEDYVQMYQKDFGLNSVCLRYFNVYGQRQGYSYYSGVITRFLNRLAKNLPLMVFGDGEQTRDFVYVQDIVEANVLALKCEGMAVGEIFNIGTGVATSINQLANTLLEITKRTFLKIVHSEAREGDIKHSVADISKARQGLHYEPRVSLREGLEELTRS